VPVCLDLKLAKGNTAPVDGKESNPKRLASKFTRYVVHNKDEKNK